MGTFGLLCATLLGLVILLGVIRLWRARTMPRGAVIRRYSGLDRWLHTALIGALCIMAVPDWHGPAGWVFCVLSILTVLRRIVRRLLSRRVARLRGSVARFGPRHRVGLAALLACVVVLAVPGWHAVAGWALLAGAGIHVAQVLRDPVALGAMACGYLRLDAARARYPFWVKALFTQRQRTRGLPGGVLSDHGEPW